MPLLAPKSDFTAAIAAINAGDLVGAETRIRARLADYPRDVNLRALLVISLAVAFVAWVSGPEQAPAAVRRGTTRALDAVRHRRDSAGLGTG